MFKGNKIIFFAFLILADQLSKYLIRHLGGFYICNSGIAFGLKIPDVIFWIFWPAIIALLVYKIYKLEYKIQNTIYYILILSGAISNILDRLYFGCIIDFVDLKFWPASNAMRSIAGWPVFNPADVFICAGVILILISNLKFKI